MLNHRRKLSREQLVFDEEVLDYLAERQEERADSSHDRIFALRKCIEKLPASQKGLIQRRYEPGASVQDIAEEDGKSEGAISQALYRIRAALQSCVEKTNRNGRTGMNEKERMQRVGELTSTLLDGLLTEPQKQELNELLRGDPDACERYLDLTETPRRTRP